MRVIDHRQFRRKHSRVPSWLRWALFGLAAFAGLFVLANVVVGLLYRNKMLPNYSVAAVPIGNIAFDRLDDEVSVESLLPAAVTLKKNDKMKEIAPKDLGMAVDWEATRRHIKQARSWLPVLSFFQRQSVPAELRIDKMQFDRTADELAKHFSEAPLPERIEFKSDNFVVSAPKDGYELAAGLLRSSLVGLLEQGAKELAVPTKTTKSDEPTGQLGNDLKLLQGQLSARIILTNGSKNVRLSRSQIGQFYQSSGQTMTLSLKRMDKVIGEVAKELGLTPVNQANAVTAAQYAINKARPVTFLLAGKGTKVYKYCVAARGLSTSVLPEFRQKLAAVYGDPQGWNRGRIAFVYAEKGCGYTAWLSAAARVTDFSASVCDNYYSCRIGANVIINYDRWKGATDPWNAAGGELEDYRVMVINHETGHWLGFGHRNCPGAGQPAPVMQQQSISLQGCTFNPWPTTAEVNAL